MADPRLATNPRPKNNEADGAVTLRVSPPSVKVSAPVVNVKVDSPQVIMDSEKFSAAISSLATYVGQIAHQQAAILQAIQDHHAVLNSMIGKQPAINVEAPQIKMAPRPTDFYVELDNENGETVGMRVRANSRN